MELLKVDFIICTHVTSADEAMALKHVALDNYTILELYDEVFIIFTATEKKGKKKKKGKTTEFLKVITHCNYCFLMEFN